MFVHCFESFWIWKVDDLEFVVISIIENVDDFVGSNPSGTKFLFVSHEGLIDIP